MKTCVQGISKDFGFLLGSWWYVYKIQRWRPRLAQVLQCTHPTHCFDLNSFAASLRTAIWTQSCGIRCLLSQLDSWLLLAFFLPPVTFFYFIQIPFLFCGIKQYVKTVTFFLEKQSCKQSRLSSLLWDCCSSGGLQQWYRNFLSYSEIKGVGNFIVFWIHILVWWLLGLGNFSRNITRNRFSSLWLPGWKWKCVANHLGAWLKLSSRSWQT